MNQLIFGAFMIVLTTTIHAAFMALGIRVLQRWRSAWPDYGSLSATLAVAAFVLVMFSAAVVEIWCWSIVFLFVGVFEAVEVAVYFTTVTYTTLGYGDITLDAPQRMLAAICAANGVIMFGWTTALVFAVVQRVYFSKRVNDTG